MPAAARWRRCGDARTAVRRVRRARGPALGGRPRTARGPGSGADRACKAASVNPIDWKAIRGATSGGKPMAGTGYLGYDAAGVVDEVGEGVTGVSVGDEVFGRGRNTQAEYAVLNAWAKKPPSVDWAVAAAAGASRRDLGAGPAPSGCEGGRDAVHRRRRGRRRRCRRPDGPRAGDPGDRVRGRGQPGLPPRDRRDPRPVRRRRGRPGPRGCRRPGRQGLRRRRQDADRGADRPGLRAVAGADASPTSRPASPAPRSPAEARTASRWRPSRRSPSCWQQNKLVIKVQTFPFERAAEAYRISEGGHVRGKLVLVP